MTSVIRNEFKKKSNEKIVSDLISRQISPIDENCYLLDNVYKAEACIEQAQKEYAELELAITFRNIDVRVFSDVCFQLNIRPEQKLGIYTATKKVHGHKIILISK